MKIIKVLLITVFLLIILAGAGCYVLLTSYKKEIAAEAIATIEERYGLKLGVGAVQVSPVSNWPQIAVQLKEVSAEADRFKGSAFHAGAVSLSFNIRELLNRRFLVNSISVKDGDILFVKRSDTTKLIADEPADDNPADDLSFEIKKIHLNNTRLRYLAPEKEKDFDLTFADNTIRVRKYSDGLDLKMKGRIFVRKMVFRENKGIFLDSTTVFVNLRANYFNDSRSLCVRPGSSARIDDQHYKTVALVNFATPKRLAIAIETKAVMLDEIRPLVNSKLRKSLANYEVKKPMDAEALLVARPGSGEEPVIIVKARSADNDILVGTSKIPYTNTSFSGKIVSIHRSMQKGDMKKATVTFDRLSGHVYGVPFTARVRVKNLKKPYVYINGKLNISAAQIPFGLQNEFELRGNAHAFIRYSGPAAKINRKQFLSKSMHLKADLDLLNLSYREKKRPYVYTLNGRARVTNNNVNFNALQLSTVVGDAVLKGTADNFVNYILGFTKGFRAKLTAHTDSLNLNPVLLQNPAPIHVQADSAVQVHTPQQTPAPDVEPVKQDSSKATVSEKLLAKKENFSRFEFDVDLFAKCMLIRKVRAEDAVVSMHYGDEILDIHNLKLYTCDGKITASGKVSEFKSVKAEVSVDNVDVQKMFTQFENFGQDAVTSENLKGNIYVQANFSSQLDDRMEVIGETMSGEVRLSLKDGQLVNFGPILRLSHFLFKNRDFNNVTFSELNESFVLRGFEMTINELEIGSNILNLYVVNGIYNFKGESNINVLLPWSNLKKRTRDHIPKTSGKKAEDVKGLKLNFSGPSNNMKVSIGHKALTELKPSI